jgi:adenine nucleotide transporter 17
MAKVRIQTRTADSEEALVEHVDLPAPHKPHHDHSTLKHPGALDILSQVWQREGMVGWYRVSLQIYINHASNLTNNSTGNGCANN